MSRIVFAGTPEFACESLRALVDAGKRPVAVLTQPDRPAGRGKKLTPGPVKTYATAAGLPVLQPESLRNNDVVAMLADLDADLFVVAAYGLLLPQAVLDIPRVGCVNVHASLLPRWRGAAPIQACILAGDEETGISLMQMEAGLDCGPVYCHSATPVLSGETAGELHDRLASMGGELLVAKIDSILAGERVPDPQDDAAATYAPKIKTDDARIDWSRTAEEIHRHVRAYNPVPGAWTTFGGERLKCWRADVIEATAAEPGNIVAAGPAGIDVACGEGALRLTVLQRPGKGRITADEFQRQAQLVGQTLGQST